MNTSRSPFARAALASAMALALAACGGSDPADTSAGNGGSRETPLTRSETATAASSNAAASDAPAVSFLPTSDAAPSAETIAAQREGTRLNAEELARIAKTGVLPKAFQGKSLSGANEAKTTSAGVPKYAESRTAVYRFFNTRTSAHFYTTSTVERDQVISTAPYMSLDGPAFDASGTDIPGLSPVYRFYNTQTGVHFYTISESERAHIATTLPQFTYEGVAYHASTLPGTGYKPLYRFFYAAKGFHFYTASSAEANTIQASMPQYVAEGIGYYVLDNDWQTPAVPHTGVNSGQCYAPGVPTLVPCAGVDATNLNAQQDGHRSGINTPNYGGVPIAGGIYALDTYPYTSCVRDNVTGLVWEGKEASGARAGTNTYSNLGVNLAADTGTYIAEVNNSKLCGFSDWRLPTAEELQSIVDYSATTAGVFRWGIFVNTQPGDYWTSTIDAAAGGKGWYVGFSAGNVSNGASLTNVRYVRLVHGPKWAGQRYMASTYTYAGDAVNNAVIDRKTGLTWRRCVEGQAWNGSACVGTAGGFTLDQALARARDQAGWRMPNAKELVSLNDPGRVSPALDAVAFPGLPSVNSTWTSTPYVLASTNAWVVDFNQGYLYGLTRTNLSAVRLVRSSP